MPPTAGVNPLRTSRYRCAPALAGGVSILPPGSLDDAIRRRGGVRGVRRRRWRERIDVTGDYRSAGRQLQARPAWGARRRMGAAGRQHWRSIMRALPSAKVTLVLSNVDFIDPDGERLLQRMADDGVEFVVAGCMNRYVIDSLKPGVPRGRRRTAMRCPARVRDAREARALISSPRYRVTAATTAQAYERQRDRGSPSGWLIGTTLALWMTTLEVMRHSQASS